MASHGAVSPPSVVLSPLLSTGSSAVTSSVLVAGVKMSPASTTRAVRRPTEWTKYDFPFVLPQPTAEAAE